MNNGSTFGLSLGDVFLSNLLNDGTEIFDEYTCLWRFSMPVNSTFKVNRSNGDWSNDDVLVFDFGGYEQEV